jgi:putative aminopeptidase FrvX
MTLMQELTLEHAYVDIGAGSREAAELRGIAYLDPVTPAGSLHGLAGGQLSGPALGTKSCAGLVLGLAGNVEEAPGLSDVQFVWLAQCRLLRRTGGRTVPVGALRARKDMAAGEVLLVDTFPVRDSDPMEIRPGMGPVLVGGGDGSALYGRLKRTAEEEGIPVQESREYTPATLIPFLDGESDAAAILLPVRFPATPSEVIWESDLEAMQRLLLAVSVKGDPR